MPEPLRDARDVPEALNQIADRWDAQRTERTLVELKRTRSARARRRRVALAASAVLAVGGVSFAAWKQAEPALNADSPALAAAPKRQLQLTDGSHVELLRADTQLRVDEQSEAQTKLELASGRARFEVVRREPRILRVTSGEVTVEVLGTAFELERSGPRTHVAVVHGRVAVRWRTGSTELGAGEAGWFPRPEPVAMSGSMQSPEPSAASAREQSRNPAVVSGGDSSPPAARPVLRRASAGKVAPPWRAPAEQGDFERAYTLLAHTPEPVSDDVEELMLAADAARLSGHPAAALPYLKRVIARHAQDSRASLAAFTLGGVLMQQLGQPREAEAAYARARELSLNSSLAEDALARQVEAAHRAGDSAHARALAIDYLARYPNGRRVHAVQRFGGLVDP